MPGDRKRARGGCAGGLPGVDRGPHTRLLALSISHSYSQRLCPYALLSTDGEALLSPTGCAVQSRSAQHDTSSTYACMFTHPTRAHTRSTCTYVLATSSSSVLVSCTPYVVPCVAVRACTAGRAADYANDHSCASGREPGLCASFYIWRLANSAAIDDTGGSLLLRVRFLCSTQWPRRRHAVARGELLPGLRSDRIAVPVAFHLGQRELLPPPRLL